MADRRIVCAAYGGGHILACLPVLALLRERGWDIELLALTVAAETARSAGFAPLGARDLIRSQGDDDILAWGEMLAAELDPRSPVPRDESIAYLGFGYAGLVRALGENGAREAFARDGRRALRPVELIERLLDRGPFDVALATSSPRAERELIEQAGRRGLRSVCLNNLFAATRDDWLFDPQFADKICVIHEFVRDQLVDAGRDPAKIVITGNPAFEQFIAAAPPHRAISRPLRLLHVSQAVIPGDEEHVAGFRDELLAVARRRHDWRIRIRPAPSETDPDWVLGPLELEPPGTGVMDSLCDADVVLTQGSTMALEGALLGVPVLQQASCVLADYAPFYRIGLARRIEDWGGIEPAIEATVALGPQRHAAIAADATERVVSVIDSLAA